MSALDFELIGSPSSSVREIDTEDGAVLLDIRQGLCLSLTPVAAEIWHLLKLNCSLEQIADRVSVRFDASQETVLEDARQVLKSLYQKGLLTSSDLWTRTKRASLPFALVRSRRKILQTRSESRLIGMRFLFWKALACLLAFDLFRFSHNFAAMYVFVHGWSVAPGVAHADAPARVCRAVNYACVFYPKSVLCLQRSAVTTCLLRSLGVPAKMVMGAQKFPFKAHAWTEVNGTPINERRDVYSSYLIWERC